MPIQPARTPVVCDNSLLADVAACDTRAVMRHVLGYTSRDDRAELRAGSAFHLAIACYLETGSALAALKTFEADYADWASAHVSGDDRLAWPNVARIFTEWLTRHPIEHLDFEVLRLNSKSAVEIGFRLPLAEDVTVVGRIDFLGRYKHDQSIVVGENKSTKYISEWYLAGYKQDSQGSTYLDGARANLSEPVTSILYNIVEFGRLPGSDRKCKEHGMAYAECGIHHIHYKWLPIERSPQAVDDWRFSAIGLARKFAWLKQAYPTLADVPLASQQGKFNRACNGCAFRDWCEADRPLDLVDSLLVHEPWEPWAHAFATEQPSGA